MYIRTWNRFIRWLFSSYFSPYAKCMECGRVGRKVDMTFAYSMGYYCTEAESVEAWKQRQW
jgi:hypothetical protein